MESKQHKYQLNDGFILAFYSVIWYKENLQELFNYFLFQTVQTSQNWPIHVPLPHTKLIFGSTLMNL